MPEIQSGRVRPKQTCHLAHRRIQTAQSDAQTYFQTHSLGVSRQPEAELRVNIHDNERCTSIQRQRDVQTDWLQLAQAAILVALS